MNQREQSVRLSKKRMHECIAEFLATIENRDTRGTYDRSLREFLRWLQRASDFRFQASDVRRYRRYLIVTRKLSDVSVSTYLTALRRLCSFLVKRGTLKTNPAELVEGVSRPRVHVRPVLSEEDVDRLVQVVDRVGEIGMRDTAIIHLMINFGLLESEIIAANVDDFSAAATGSLKVKGKGRKTKDLSVTLEVPATDLVLQYQALRKELYGEPKSGDPLFLSAGNRTRGQRMSTRGLRGIVNQYLIAAGLKTNGTVTPHSLRRTAARRMADAGATPDEIKNRLRLGTIATAKLYMRNSKTN